MTASESTSESRSAHGQVRPGPPEGTRRTSGKLGAATCALGSLLTAGAGAQQPGERYFHVTRDTYGCVNPRATMALTNRDDPRQRDPGWVAFVVADGRCAPITPRSPWRLVSAQGELFYMTYAGATGLPGSFYLRASELSELPPPPSPSPPPAAVSQPAPPYVPPADSFAPPQVPSPPWTPEPPPSAAAADAGVSGYINPPEAAAPTPRPTAPLPERRAPAPQNVFRERTPPVVEPKSAPAPAVGAGEDGRLAGGVLAVLIVLGCAVKRMRNTTSRTGPATSGRRPGT